ncbi:HECT-domain (ubiquitin-transferase) domain-containing protein [Babesia caballi]|uniref:HECT-domain (Ubiquitin-transferase) domain-containing protein n=1 Tax=Babesia caballi TaxID=5871 RepID=A0AAV4LUH8_BABCB|nr:HECT-domain (ubiquitin-transferase) domain-containing protein [Babesia caballi]
MHVRSCGELGCLRQSVRRFGVSGSYGPSIYGIQTTQTNARLIRLPEEKPPPQIHLNPRIHVTQWPGKVRALRAGYFFREGQRTNTGYYHMLIKNKKDICLVANADKRQTASRTIENCLYERTRGFSGQVLLHGRGVKAFFEPAFPNLMFRLGVGSNCLDATRICTMYAKHVKVDVDRTGLIVSVHGYNKMMVGNVVYRLFRLVEANPYTLKGGHIANYPIKKKVPKKR